jgi:uncharacterized protein
MKLILDTNVYFSALIFDKTMLNLVDYCFENHTIYASNQTIFEVNRILATEKAVKLLSKNNYRSAKVFLAKIITESTYAIPSTEISDICRDPKDNMFLELAREVKADYIITGDKDLLVLDEFEGTKIRKGGDWLLEVGLEL